MLNVRWLKWQTRVRIAESKSVKDWRKTWSSITTSCTTKSYYRLCAAHRQAWDALDVQYNHLKSQLDDVDTRRNALRHELRHIGFVPPDDPFQRDRALFAKLSRERGWSEGTWVLIMNDQLFYAGPSEQEALDLVFSVPGHRCFLECVRAPANRS